MSTVTRIELFERVARKLRADFEELSNIPHRGAKGASAEHIVRDFLSAHLPRRFAVGTGFILDQKDQISKQTDVIVYDAFNCPVYRSDDDDAGIFPNDNVAAVVEVKAKLDADRLAEAVANIAAAKSLGKVNGAKGPEQWATLGCLFAFESALTLETLTTKYHALLNGTRFGHHIDLIIVLDRGLITLVTCPPGGMAWSKLMSVEGSGGPSSEGWHIGIAPTELRDRSLDAFMRILVAHLVRFRHAVGEPGFDWGALGAARETKVTYLTTSTHERDPVKRDAKLRAYRDEFKRRFP